MYLKVPYGPPTEPGRARYTTVEEVEAAIKEIAPDVEGIRVIANNGDLPDVFFADGFAYEEYKRIEQALNARGFEAY